MKNGPLIILAAVSRLHLLSERVLSLFSYTLSIPVKKRFRINVSELKVCFSADFNGNTKRLASQSTFKYSSRRRFQL